MPVRPLVVKFGGTSVGSVEALNRSIEIVAKTKEDWPQQVVVLSAMSGVTDVLLESAEKANRGDLITYKQAAKELRTRHEEALLELVPSSDADRVLLDIGRSPPGGHPARARRSRLVWGAIINPSFFRWPAGPWNTRPRRRFNPAHCDRRNISKCPSRFRGFPQKIGGGIITDITRWDDPGC
jgi:hypothetical protein